MEQEDRKEKKQIIPKDQKKNFPHGITTCHWRWIKLVWACQVVRSTSTTWPAPQHYWRFHLLKPSQAKLPQSQTAPMFVAVITILYRVLIQLMRCVDILWHGITSLNCRFMLSIVGTQNPIFILSQLQKLLILGDDIISISSFVGSL